MNTITYSQRYLPHELNTKFFAVKLYRAGVGVSFVCRRYHISKSSLLRWNKKFDGYRIITGVTLISLFVNSMANFAPIKAIPAIPAHCTAFTAGWATPVMLLPPRSGISRSPTILQLLLASNGRWM